MLTQDASLLPLSPNNDCIHKMKVHAHSLIKSILTEENGEESEGWEFVALKKGVAISRKKPVGSDLNMMRGKATFRCHIDVLREMLQDFRHTSVYDPSWIHGERLEPSVEEGDMLYEMLHFQFRAPFPVTNRDFVLFGVRQQFPDGSFVQVSDSAEHHVCPEMKGYVRGELKASGYIARPGREENTTDVVYIVGINPKGYIPSWVVNLVSTDQPLNLATVRQYIETGLFETNKGKPWQEWTKLN